VTTLYSTVICCGCGSIMAVGEEAKTHVCVYWDARMREIAKAEAQKAVIAKAVRDVALEDAARICDGNDTWVYDSGYYKAMHDMASEIRALKSEESK
jgi:predicted RNA methylase